VQGDGFPGIHVCVFSCWCVVSGGEEGWEGGFGFEGLLPKLGWGLALFVGGALLSFAEVVKSKGPVKLRVPLVERRELDLLPTVRPVASEEVRLTLDCSVMEKERLGKDLLLKLQGKEHPTRFLSAEGALGSARKILPRLNVGTWRNLLVRMMGRIVDWSFVCFQAGSKTHFQF
jgi:hypothetical protein